jgi:hypothetical protein
MNRNMKVAMQLLSRQTCLFSAGKRKLIRLLFSVVLFFFWSQNYALQNAGSFAYSPDGQSWNTGSWGGGIAFSGQIWGLLI